MTSVQRYISKPIEVNAIQVNQFGDFQRAVRWIRDSGGDAVFSPALNEGAEDCIILAVDGVYVDVTAGMYIVQDPDGQFRAIREGSFKNQFERAFDEVYASGGTLPPPYKSLRVDDGPHLTSGAAQELP
jgi:hypothetical protein